MLLADFCSGRLPRCLTFGTRRKHLTTELKIKIDAFLKSHYSLLLGQAARLHLKQYLAQHAAKMRSVPSKNRRDLVVKGTLARLAEELDINITDVMGAVDVGMLDTIIYNEQETLEWRAGRTSHELQLAEDLAHAKTAVNEMSPRQMFGQWDHQEDMDCDKIPLPKYSVTKARGIESEDSLPSGSEFKSG
jgi:hypothetical protein